MDNNLDQNYFQKTMEIITVNSQRTQQNERIAYENIDPLEILIKLPKKRMKFRRKQDRFLEFQDNILEYKNESGRF